jgi:hypothetical protein
MPGDVITLSLLTGEVVTSPIPSATIAGSATEPCTQTGFDPRQWACRYTVKASDALGLVPFNATVGSATRNTTSDDSFVNTVSELLDLPSLSLSGRPCLHQPTTYFREPQRMQKTESDVAAW